MLLTILSVLAYANAWPDVLVYDDKAFLAGGHLAAVNLSDISRFFTENLWAASGQTSGIYRPLFMVWMALESRLFGSWYAGHHLVNIALHALATATVYLLIRRLLLIRGKAVETAQLAATLAAAVFAVHPVHAEVVNSVFNRSELFVGILLIGGLAWFLKARLQKEWVAWLGLSAIYFVALLFRESAASLPALAAALVFLLSRGSFLNRVRQCLPVLLMLLPLGAYLYLRKQALTIDVAPLVSAAGVAGDVAAAGTTSAEIPVNFKPEYFFRAVRLWMESIKHLLWPYPLQIYYEKLFVDFWLAAAIQLALLSWAGWRYFKMERGGLLIGLAFFYLTLLPSSRLIAEGGAFPELADRYLYLPSVGLSITLGFGLALLLSGAFPRVRPGRAQQLAGGVVLAICLVFTPLTWARNADWSNEIRLFETDYAREEMPRKIMYTLIGAHLSAGNYQRAIELCRKHQDVVSVLTVTKMRCASSFIGAGRPEVAERIYLDIVSTSDYKTTLPWVHYQLASLYAQTGRRNEAESHFSQALAYERMEYMREFYLGSQLLMLYPNHPARKQEARAHLERSLQLQPRFGPAREALKKLD